MKMQTKISFWQFYIGRFILVVHSLATQHSSLQSTAVAEIQVKAATAAAQTNTHLQTERLLENAKTFQRRRKSTQQNQPGQGSITATSKYYPY